MFRALAIAGKAAAIAARTPATMPKIASGVGLPSLDSLSLMSEDLSSLLLPGLVAPSLEPLSPPLLPPLARFSRASAIRWRSLASCSARSFSALACS